MDRRSVAVILSGFPRRSETFAIGELLALHERGVLAALVATKPGDSGPAQPGVERLEPIVYRVDGGSEEQASQVAERLRRLPLAGIHAYFAHTPAEIAAGAARRLGLPYSFSVHARDARKVSRAQLRQRAAEAACVVACNADVAREVDGTARLHLVPHGVDLQRFVPNVIARERTVRLLAVGRLVEKKGFSVLVAAMATLDDRFTLRIVGDGPERRSLETEIAELGLASRVHLCGPATHHDLPGEYARADIVVAPSIVDRDGDRDGLPNVVLEALASGRPVVASAVGAVASAVRDGHTGLLVPPGDAASLRSALRMLGNDVLFRAALARAGRRLVEREYDIRHSTATFAGVLAEAYA